MINLESPKKFKALVNQAHQVAEEVLRRQRELFVVAADLATNPDHRDRLRPGVSLVTAEMVDERVGDVIGDEDLSLYIL